MSKQSAVAKKSPLKERPLRLPGQSIQNQMDDLLDEQILPYLFITFCLVAFTIYEFLTMWFSWERQPYTLLLLTLLNNISGWYRQGRMTPAEIGRQIMLVFRHQAGG